MTMETPVRRAHDLGQSIWLDDLSRELLESGKLEEYIRRGIRGVTSNPKIFDHALSEGDRYDETIRRLAAKGASPEQIYEQVAVEDVQSAADLLRRHFGVALEQDGFVSLEVSPKLAYDTTQTIEEARRLWKAVDRPNLMIKVPGTEAGMPAIRQLTAEGINVNVTLLFGIGQYREAASAYIEGLCDAAASGRDLSSIRSVASFFLSRIDVLVDGWLDEISKDTARAKQAKTLRGEAAIASAKLAYHACLELFQSDRFLKLAQKGALRQHLLWGSTSVKNPSYSDVKYVEALIGPGTVSTVPPKTFEAFVDHGRAEPLLGKNVPEAARRMEQLQVLGIDMTEATQRLIREGVQKFQKPFDHMLRRLQEKKAA